MKTFSLANVLNSPGSSLAGLAAILAAFAHAMGPTPPQSTLEWIVLLGTFLTSVGAMFSRGDIGQGGAGDAAPGPVAAAQGSNRVLA
jgi:hypothetical protein